MVRTQAGRQLPVPPVETIDPRTVRLDPVTFQFKESDAAGVTGALRGVEKWEPTSPPIMVYERIDGQRFVADGHQRFNKYLELQRRGHKLPPLAARVFREADGWTVPEVVRLASLRNIQEGSAQPLDIARLIWNGGQLTPDELARVPKTMVVGERLARGEALGRITHPTARQMLINKQVDPDYASFVGKYITDPDQQLAALQKLAKMDLDNLRQAEDAVIELAQGDFEQMSLMDMFGGQDVQVPLAETKAKIADAARRALHEQRAAFAGAVRHATSLREAGNILVEEQNLRNLSEARQLAALFDRFARARGTHTNAALTEAARSVVRGDTQPAAHLDTILAAVRRDLESGIIPDAPKPAEPAPEPPVAAHPGGPGEPPPGPGALAEAPAGLPGGLGGAVTPPEPPGLGALAELMGVPEATPTPGPLAELMGMAPEPSAPRVPAAPSEPPPAAPEPPPPVAPVTPEPVFTVEGLVGFKGKTRPTEAPAPGPAAGAVETPPPAPEAPAPTGAESLPMKTAPLGQYLAPPGKNYIFIKLTREVAEAHPELRQKLRDAGFTYRRKHEAWFRTLPDAPPNKRAEVRDSWEDLAYRLLGGRTESFPEEALESRPIQPIERPAPTAAPERVPEVSAPEPGGEAERLPVLARGESAGETVAPTGEIERRLFTPEEMVPLETQPMVQSTAELEDLLQRALERRMDLNLTPHQRRAAAQDIIGLADELARVADQLSDETLRKLVRELRFVRFQKRIGSSEFELATRRLRPFEEALWARKGKPPTRPEPAPAGPTDLFSQPAPEPEPAPAPTPPAAPEPPRPSPAGEPAARTSRAIPPNVRSYLRQRLGWTDEQIDALTPEEAIEAGRSQRRPPGSSPASSAEPAPLAVPSEPPAPASQAITPESLRQARSLEELLAGYVAEDVPTKIQRIAERGKRAQFALAKRRVPREETYRGGVEPQADTPRLPARLERPYEPPVGRATELAQEGRSAEQIEAAIEAEARERGARREAWAAQPKARLTEQEAAIKGVEPPGPPERESLPRAGTRDDRARAEAMRQLLEKGDEKSLRTYEALLADQVVREAEQTARAGTKAEWESVKRWGDELSRLTFDKETGEYLGSGFAALERFYRSNPALFWRAVGGTAIGLILGDQEGFDGYALIGSGLIGGAIGASLSPAALRRLAPRARAAMPAIARSVQRMWQEAKADVRQAELLVRRPRDYTKDIGFVSQFWRSVSSVEPDLYVDLFRLAHQEQQALGAVTMPETRQLLRRAFTRELLREIRTASQIAKDSGFHREARYLRYYADKVAGVPTLAAQFFSRLTAGEVTPNQVENVFRLMESHIYRLLIGFAVDTGLVNRTQVLMNIPRLGLRGTLKGIKLGRTKLGKEQALAAGMRFEYFPERGRLPEPAEGVVEALDKLAMAPMKWSEERNRIDSYLAAYEYARTKGYPREQADQFAIELTSQTQSIPGRLAGNPYLHQLGPLRALARFPTLMAEFFVDALTHPDPRVALRLVGMGLGAAGLTALTGWGILQALVPKITLLGPAWDWTRALLSEEERRHLTQFLPGGEPPSHRLVEDIGRMAVPRYLAQTWEKVQARLPRAVGGYGYGLEPRPVFDRTGRVQEPARTAIEDLANALGLRSVAQESERSSLQEQRRFEHAERASRTLQATEGYRKLRDALERGDREAIRAAEQMLTPGQLREFYREGWRTPTERLERRLPREVRERFRQRFRTSTPRAPEARP